MYAKNGVAIMILCPCESFNNDERYLFDELQNRNQNNSWIQDLSTKAPRATVVKRHVGWIAS